MLINSPKALDDAWELGYKTGWGKFKHTDPFVPPRPQSHPMGTNDASGYFYQEGYKKGVQDSQIKY